MKTKFIQCGQCQKDIPLDSCEFASYRMNIEDEEHIFCCKACAERYKQKKKQ
ncbi:MAG: hypothetical protein PVF96_06855 [Candidatus Bathyarchaeota archaeon]